MAYTDIGFEEFGEGVQTEYATLLPPAGRVVYCHHSGGRTYDTAAIRNRTHTTLQGALGQCASGNNDTVFVLPGHAENISGADQMTNLVAGVNIIGLGNGDNRPTFTWTTATSTFLFDVASVTMKNCILKMCSTGNAGVTVAAPITVSASGCAIKNCRIEFGGDADDLVTVGVTVTGDHFTFENNRCFGAVAAPITAAGTFIRLTGADYAVIQNNYIAGGLATDTDGLIETITTASTFIKIFNNFIYANATGNTCAIDAGQDLVCSGFIGSNTLVVDADGTAQTTAFTVHANNNFALDPYNFMVSNNNERGLIVGTATT